MNYPTHVLQKESISWSGVNIATLNSKKVSKISRPYYIMYLSSTNADIAWIKSGDVNIFWIHRLTVTYI